MLQNATRSTLRLLAALSLATLPLGTVACSHGSSPTEPSFDLEQATVTADPGAVTADPSGLTAVTNESKGGGKGRGRGRGADDPAGDDRGGRRGGRGGRGGQEDNPKPARGQEFEGAVASVAASSLTLANGTRVVVNAQTQWVARGDLRSLDQVAGSVAARRPTRVEGRGTRQADGAILAQSIKAEVD